MYYKIEVDMVLSADGDEDKMQDIFMDALIDVAEQFGGQLAGSLKLVPTTEEERMEEVLDEQAATDHSLRQGGDDHILARNT
jgi:hypothetical protein